MLIRLNKFLSSDAVSLNVNENYVIDDKEFLSKTCLNTDINLKETIFKVEDNILLNVTIKYTFLDECERCLENFDNTVETKFEAIVVQKINEDEEFDEIQLLITDGCVVLDEIIKQMIYLSMPMKSLCKADCKGICPTCGVNLNYEKCKCENNLTDPRFNKLKDLLKD
ncbi:MAG: DUF177 domain-containing protein [Sedimentibacter sp.]|uniref:YceD family protein n=1 Tax=Sedimentibacter sp. TaxID=1960295 RepID=UPI0029826BBD|nr:DUF177 domain-containing protein [Sedimentibacter sp.]MDW5300280.1 DUF177 domain-containing protein [Sedimentibacter sp.]